MLMKTATRNYEVNIEKMKCVAQNVLDRRRREPSDKKNLLNALIRGQDPQTGETMSDENIINNMLTFLIAGHETTSGLLSFTVLSLLKNSSAYHKAQQEVDRVIGSSTIKFEHLAQLEYRESEMRLLAVADDRLPSEVVFVTATFEGTPGDNAGKFVGWLRNEPDAKLSGVQFAVFGCGHHDWSSTYQKVPKWLDDILVQRGATRLTHRGESDVALGTVLDDFDCWTDSSLWPAISGDIEQRTQEDFNGLDIEISPSARASNLKHDVFHARIEGSALLTGPGVREKRQIVFRLPSHMTYSAGDYLNVLPVNPPETVSRVLRIFGLPWDAEITIQPTSHTSLPVNAPWPVAQLLSEYVELGSPASKKSILGLASLGEDSSASTALRELTEAPTGPVSVLDILERYPDLPCPFGFFLSLLPPMCMRRYSTSSSPVVDPTLVSLTYSVLDERFRNRSESRFLGVTTNYLKRLEIGNIAQVSVRESHYSFHLPADPKVPVIMICAGTGITPFRGFAEERAEKIRLGQQLGQALLFIGCRNANSDRLYASDLEKWEKAGAATLFYAFSQHSWESAGCKYVQDRLHSERRQVAELLSHGAKVFVCGSSKLGTAVKAVFQQSVIEDWKESGLDVGEDVDTWFDDLQVQGRWSSDLFD
ncbi:uncharacterized protein APUU_60805A [Aspergillus puulaauensis]|uniref:NADPH--hemoprotein reductase n=1 Tax=Aspergillus puulaauensis TaxID=1220207 RepID=A0A7R7XU32_9EURO|nr:uncharacterized protein APUU_60805A [Aspergillus puulaauensis]BCS27757.1 hypothetical protein APUU_60805A [Aspergillus puulaauensis]